MPHVRILLRERELLKHIKRQFPSMIELGLVVDSMKPTPTDPITPALIRSYGLGRSLAASEISDLGSVKTK